ncbi:MAG: thioredoxin [Anaerorhabdus sp.]
MKIIKTVQEFDEIVAQQDALLIDFFAEWCGPCKMIAPILEELAISTPSVEIVKVDVDVLPEIAQRFEVMSIPTLCTFKGGVLKQKVVGFQPKPQLEKLIQEVL